METILKFIENNFGLSFLIGVLVVSAIISGIIHLSIWCFKVVTKNKELEKQYNNLPCLEHRSDISSHNTRLTDMASTLGKIEGKIELLLKSSSNKIITSSSSFYSEKNSPRKLNDNGLKLLEDIEGNKFLDAHAQFFITEIEALNPLTALDVENLALVVLCSNSDRDIFKPLKNWVYKAPIQSIKSSNDQFIQKDITLDDVLFVLSIPLRDRYLQLHQEISIE